MKKITLILLIFLFNLGFSKNIEGKNGDKEIITHEKLYTHILSTGIKFPDVVFAQAVIETGNFTSKLYKQGNNLFGMKIPKKRKTLAIGKNNGGYAFFDSWISSVDDYKLWQEHILKSKNVKTKKEYLNLLNRVYANNKSYITHLNRVMDKHKNLFEQKK